VATESFRCPNYIFRRRLQVGDCRGGGLSMPSPHKDAWMISQPGDLVPQRSTQQPVMAPFSYPHSPRHRSMSTPAWTRIPSRGPVRFSKKSLAVKPLPWPDSVSAHIAPVCQIRIQSRRRTSGKRSSGAKAAPRINSFLPFDLEQRLLLLRQFRNVTSRIPNGHVSTAYAGKPALQISNDSFAR